MSAHAPKFPTHDEVAYTLRQLIGGAIARDEAARWAAQWVMRLDEDTEEARKLDVRLCNALSKLSAADLISTDRPYLYDESDFERWLNDLTS